MSVQFYKTGIVSASGTLVEVSQILTDEFNNYLVDESGNYLVSDIIWNEYGFVEGTEIMSIYDGAISAREFIEY